MIDPQQQLELYNWIDKYVVVWFANTNFVLYSRGCLEYDEKLDTFYVYDNNGRTVASFIKIAVAEIIVGPSGLRFINLKEQK